MARAYSILPLILSIYSVFIRKNDLLFEMVGTHDQQVLFVKLCILYWCSIYGFLVYLGYYLLTRIRGSRMNNAIVKIPVISAMVLFSIKIILHLFSIGKDYAQYQIATGNITANLAIIYFYSLTILILVFRWYIIYKL